MTETKNLSNTEIAKEIKNFEKQQGINDSKSRVLIIDDDPWIIKILKKYLTDIGFEVIGAENPVDGIALAIRHRPLLVFLDIIMPDIKGTVMLQMLKKIDITSKIPVIILSGNLSKEVLGNAFKNGAAGFISKPFDEEILIEKLKEVLGSSVSKLLDLDDDEVTLDKEL